MRRNTCKKKSGKLFLRWYELQKADLKKTDTQIRKEEKFTHAYHVHCVLHNLNLVLKDAMKAVTRTRQFYDTIESEYNFFGDSIVRWQKLKNVHDRSCLNPT